MIEGPQSIRHQIKLARLRPERLARLAEQMVRVLDRCVLLDLRNEPRVLLPVLYWRKRL